VALESPEDGLGVDIEELEEGKREVGVWTVACQEDGEPLTCTTPLSPPASKSFPSSLKVPE